MTGEERGIETIFCERNDLIGQFIHLLLLFFSPFGFQTLRELLLFFILLMSSYAFFYCVCDFWSRSLRLTLEGTSSIACGGLIPMLTPFWLTRKDLWLRMAFKQMQGPVSLLLEFMEPYLTSSSPPFKLNPGCCVDKAGAKGIGSGVSGEPRQEDQVHD